MSTIRLRRLQADFQRLQEYLRLQPRVRLIQAEGDPPERYQLEYQVQGLRQVDEQLQVVASHMVEIFLPLSYPRMAPQCRMLTPVFHPNIAPHAICIGDHWNAGEPLWSMVARIGEMIAYQSYNTKSPLNGEAARWVEGNMARVPLDRAAMFVDERPAAQRSTAMPVAGGPIPVVPVLPTTSPVSHSAAKPRPAGAATPSLPTVAPLPPPAPSSSPSPPVVAPLPPRPAPAARAASGPAATGSVGATIEIACPNCQAVYRAPAALAGKRARCRRCQAIVEIPPG